MCAESPGWGNTRFTGTFDVYWRTSDGEFNVGQFSLPDPLWQSSALAIYGAALPDGVRPDAVQVILRPVPGSAKYHRYSGEPPPPDVELPEIIFPMQRVLYRKIRWHRGI